MAIGIDFAYYYKIMKQFFAILMLILFLGTTISAADGNIPPIAVKHFSNGLIYEAEGNLEQAVASYLIALNFVPGETEIMRSIADTYMMMNMPHKAIEYYTKLVEIEPEREGFRRDAANAAFMVRDNVTAEKHMRWIIEKGRPDFTDRMQYAVILMSMGKSKNALKSLEQTESYFPNEPAVYGLKGNILLDREEYRKALEAFRRSVELDPTYSRGYMGMSAAFEYLGMRDSLIAVQKTFVDMNPDNPQVRRQLVNLLVLEQLFGMALSEAEIYLRLVPEDWEMLRRMAFLAYFEDKNLQSAEYFGRLLEWDASDHEARLFLAQVLFELDSISSAIYHIETALAQKRDPDAVITLAFAYEHDGRASEAIELLRRDGAEFSDNAALPVYEGVIAGRAKDYGRAIDAYNRALEIEPDNQDALFGLGDAYVNTNRREDAIGIFRELWRDNSEDPIVANYLGYLLIEDNSDLEFAGGLIEFALEKEPENAAYIDSYGWYLYRIGEYKKALEYLLRADSLAEIPDPVIFEHIGEVYEKLSKTDLAVEYYKKALELNPDLEHSKSRMTELE